jgi:hypothetical protein
MAPGPVLVIVLLLLLVGALPAWPHSRGWSYRPMGVIGALLLFVVLLRWVAKF